MREWAIELFTTYGATIQAGAGDDLVVDLPPDMATHFGQERLYLTFSPDRMSRYEDIVAFGSRVFDQMTSWLADKGARTAIALPSRVTDPLDEQALPPGLSLYNVTARVRSHASRRVLARFDLRLTATADQRRDELLTVVLDRTGNLYPELASEAIAGESWKSKTLLLPKRACERLAGLAIDAAQTRAAEMAAEMHAQVQAQIQTAHLRLATYYRQRIGELDPEDENTPALTEQLERECERKQAEELARSQVRVTIAPVSWALLAVPFLEYDLELRRPAGKSLALRVGYDLYRPGVRPATCHTCGHEVTELGLCDQGHVACPDCLHTCAACGRDICAPCGIVKEHLGVDWVCTTCAVTCSGCGRPTLPAHTAQCATCGRTFCRGCLQTCAHCDRPFCTKHIAACTICGKRCCDEHQGICHICQRPVCQEHHTSCPICEQECCSEHLGICSLCGQDVCTRCLEPSGTCQSCRSLIAAELWAAAPPPVPWARAYRWRQASNARWTIYYGRRKGWLWHVWAVVVTDRAGNVRYEKRPGPIETMLHRPGTC